MPRHLPPRRLDENQALRAPVRRMLACPYLSALPSPLSSENRGVLGFGVIICFVLSPPHRGTGGNSVILSRSDPRQIFLVLFLYMRDLTNSNGFFNDNFSLPEPSKIIEISFFAPQEVWHWV